jgi:hypothetical protein
MLINKIMTAPLWLTLLYIYVQVHTIRQYYARVCGQVLQQVNQQLDRILCLTTESSIASA